MSTAARRHIPLEGTPNFRDMGGYETKDGRTVKWRKLFRSGTLADLTDDDHARIGDLAISKIFDLRTDDERKNYPSRLPQQGPAVVTLSIHGRDIVRDEDFDLAAYLRSLTSAQLAENIKLSYNTFVTTYAHQYRSLFEHLGDHQDGAALIHCAAGKDRTGVACALVLHALGVPDEVILEDYTLTNNFLGEEYREKRRAQLIPGGMEFEVDLEDALFEARLDYIHSAFDAIASEFGSLDGYLSGALHLSDDKKEKLRDNFLG